MPVTIGMSAGRARSWAKEWQLCVLGHKPNRGGAEKVAVKHSL
jgi:hypothetical protein